jgi:hypothetical protein
VISFSDYTGFDFLSQGAEVMLLDVLAVIRKKLVLHLLSREGLKVSCSQLNDTLDVLVIRVGDFRLRT